LRTYSNLDTGRLFRHVVAAGTLYSLLLMEEVSERLGLAWEPREVTEGRRPVMEISGIPHELICWQSTRRQQIEAAYDGLVDWYEGKHHRKPGERARYGLARWAAEDTRPAKKTPLPLAALRERWRASATRRFGAALIDSLLQRAQAAAAAIRARVRPVVDVGLAAVDVTAVVYVMRGSFARRVLTELTVVFSQVSWGSASFSACLVNKVLVGISRGSSCPKSASCWRQATAGSPTSY
jgi:hypothetical protein